MKRYLPTTCFLCLGACAWFAQPPEVSASTEIIDVPSARMNKTYQAAIVLPDSYAVDEKSYPVLYLLHGGFGHYDDWITRLADAALHHRHAGG
jgi:enterochelin esterase-like enzyme